ncbi:hypothetical protein DFJ73DRAFT_825915 [Zopfochytrium polystomum]|nr:hypothetical protein DFJ73DRAFT_825915 [Zopfochytrium polystomum]
MVCGWCVACVCVCECVCECVCVCAGVSVGVSEKRSYYACAFGSEYAVDTEKAEKGGRVSTRPWRFWRDMVAHTVQVWREGKQGCGLCVCRVRKMAPRPSNQRAACGEKSDRETR